ncbi:MAG: hypothetical protein ABI557_04315 [Aureliella sp.]
MAVPRHTNADGDLTNDPKTKWESAEQDELTQYSGEGKIDLGDQRLGSINFYRFDPDDDQEEQEDQFDKDK